MTSLWVPVRRAWRRLTSMRTALILLFLLAVAAVPGSLLPQSPLNPERTAAYIKSHGAWGRFLDSVGVFDVFGSVWFAAIYLLLFISLVGCLIPRIRVHARGVVRKPLPAPRNLDRLPESGSFETADPSVVYAAAARKALGRRWRIVRREEPSGAVTLSAEKGYSRETGNLIFHVALLVSLVLIAVGRLYSYQGSRIVIQGADQGFCNVVSQYDSWKPGRFAAQGKIAPAPFCIDEMSKFTATYTAAGEPSQFAADVVYQRTDSSLLQKTRITVNHPLRLEGDRVYLIGHGFAPRVTIRVPGRAPVTDTEPFVPQNASTLQSEGAFKEQGPPDANADVGVAATFSPTPVLQTAETFTSSSPQVRDPVLGIAVYLGNLNYNGLPQSVYALDTSKMTRLGGANLRVGQTQTFKNGVSVRFDGWVPWASMQVSHDPSQGYLLWSALAMVLGLLGSLGVRRRRLWIRLTPSDPDAGASPTVVSVGGLARSDSGNFTTEFAGLLARLQGAGRPAHEVVLTGKGLTVAGIDGSAAHLSDTVFTTAIAVYALAMVSYTAEYAFGRRGRIAATSALPARTLVRAGGPGSSTLLASASTGGEPDLNSAGDNNTGGTVAGDRIGGADKAGRLAVALTVLGVLLHAGSIAIRGVAVDAVPWSNMYEFASVAGLVGVVAFLGVLWKAPAIRHLGGFILLPVILMMFLAGTVLYSKAQPLVPALQSYWLAIHVTLVSVAEGALMTSAVLTVLFLVKQRNDKRLARGASTAGRLGNLASRLPPAETLDKVAYRIVAFAFPLYTVAIICGAIWAEAAWGRYWGWDPKETWAFIVWVIYACYLHARATAGWKGRAAAWVNLAGFFSITFNFLVVNIVVSGLHSYAGLS